MTTVYIASTNDIKVQAIKKAFDMYFEKVHVFTDDTKSGVDRQPFDKAVVQGAQNRIRNLKEVAKYYDYLVACEGGIINLYGDYFNLQYVIIENKYGIQARGISQAFPVPEQFIEDIKKTSINKVFGLLFGENSGLRKISHGTRTRENLIQEATIMALTGIINGKTWQ